jgi:Ti-type conjugative transfer relaxase TraA
MAIYHFSGTIISRSQGRSAVACAAYRSAEKLHDEKYERDHDYTKKQDVAFSEILLPENVPEKFKDRETLWNAVELSEKRKDAQLAREFNFALPRELTLEQNIFLSKEFVKENFVSHGMIADLCIHNDKGSDGQLHPHAHVMLTMREVNENGFGQKERSWNDKALLLLWRENWSEITNKHLALHGHDIAIDHRTLKAQGIALEPQHKIGAVLARDRLIRMEDHQRIAYENGEKLLLNPEIALHAITHQQSTFTHQDLARFVNRHTLDSNQFSLVYEKVKSCEKIVPLGLDDKERMRFTTQEMLALENRMMSHAMELQHKEGHTVDAGNITHALLQKNLSDEQRGVFDHVVSGGDLKCVVGFAGTGKSYLLGAAREAFESQGFSVSGVTLSGIAAENLEGSSGILSRTLASRCHYWDKGEQKLGANDILVVDEAGMLSSRQMARLMDEAKVGGAKVVLVGDPQQLQAIEAGAAFRSISERTHYLELTEIRRQQEGWQREATKEFALGKTDLAIQRYEKASHLHEFETTAFAKKEMVSLWNDVRLNHPDKTQIMLAYTRKDVLELNTLARELRFEGELKTDRVFQTERGERAFAEKDRVYFLKNDRSLGVMNGTLGTIESVQEGSLRIKLDQAISTREAARCVTLSMDRYNHLDYGYAATIHKAQGVTVDRSYVLASRYLDAHSTYVGMSRHRESADLFYGRDEFLKQTDLVKTLSRDRAKDMALDYPHPTNKQEFAAARGLIDENMYGKGQTLDQHKAHSRDEERLMRQAKLREFTEKTQLLRASREMGQERSRVSSLQNERRPDFSDFKRQFELKNPERAQALSLEIAPKEQKKALVLMKEFERLEKIIEKGDRSSHLAKEHLKTLAQKMYRQKEVMQHVLERDEKMGKQINEMAKTLQKERDFGLGL